MLAHRIPDGQQPASRTSKKPRNYAQVEFEGLACVFGLMIFQFGYPFQLHVIINHHCRTCTHDHNGTTHTYVTHEKLYFVKLALNSSVWLSEYFVRFDDHCINVSSSLLTGNPAFLRQILGGFFVIVFISSPCNENIV